MTNPINTLGINLIDWNAATFTTGKNAGYTGYTTQYSYGDRTFTQKQPVYRSGNTLVTDTNYDTTKFI